MGKSFRLVSIIVLSMLSMTSVFTACGGGSSSTNPIAPTATVSPAINSTLFTAQKVVVTFSASMTTASVTLGGALASEATTAWTTTTNANDTLTIIPTTEWTAGSKTLTIDAVDSAGTPASQTSLTYTIMDTKYVNGAFTGTEAGTAAAPYKTIQAAITASTSGWVLVAEGTYSANGPVVTMKDGVSLYGGFKNGDWNTRNTGTNVSIITDTKATDGTDTGSGCNRAVEFSTSISTATIFDGFTVNSSNNAFSATILITNDASPTIQNNILIAGAGSVSPILNISIYDNAGTAKTAPVIQNNTLKAQNTTITTGQMCQSIRLDGGYCNATVTGNTIELPNRISGGIVRVLLANTATDLYYSIKNNIFKETDSTPVGTVQYYIDGSVTVTDISTGSVITTDTPAGDTLYNMGNRVQ